MKTDLAICLIIKDEGEYLSEWLKWHTDCGVERFYIYDNGSRRPVSDDIPKVYLPQCEVIPFGGYHKRAQVDAYKDCLDRHRFDTEWIGFIDTDEFIRVVSGTDLRTFLSDYNDVDAIAIPWVVYNANGHIHKDLSCPVRERFTKAVEYPRQLPQCKCIVRPRSINIMDAHGPIQTGGQIRIVNEDRVPVSTPLDNNITGDKIVVDHYFTRSYEEWVEKMERGSCDPYSYRPNSWFSYLNPDMKDV